MIPYPVITTRSQISWARVFAVCVALLSFVAAIRLLMLNTTDWKLAVGIACSVVFINTIMGSPVEQVLTKDSETRIRQWVSANLNSSDDTK